MSKLKTATRERYYAPVTEVILYRTVQVLCGSVLGMALPEADYDDTGLEF